MRWKANQRARVKGGREGPEQRRKEAKEGRGSEGIVWDERDQLSITLNKFQSWSPSLTFVSPFLSSYRPTDLSQLSPAVHEGDSDWPQLSAAFLC